jgi:hypothetical protein
MGGPGLTWEQIASGTAGALAGAAREGCTVSEFIERRNARTSLALNELMPPGLRRSPEQMTHIQRCQSSGLPRHICGPACGLPGGEAAPTKDE